MRGGGGGYRETEENAHLLKEQLNSMTRKAERVELLTSQLGKLQVHNEVSTHVQAGHRDIIASADSCLERQRVNFVAFGNYRGMLLFYCCRN